MAHHVTRITTLIGSAIVSATALAAPQPFDEDLVAALAANPSFPLPEDEEVVLHYIASCARDPAAVPRVAVEPQWRHPPRRRTHRRHDRRRQWGRRT